MQFIGSIVACARNGNSKTRSNDFELLFNAAGASPSLRATLPGCSASATYFFMMSALFSVASGPSFHFTSRACAPFDAAQ